MNPDLLGDSNDTIEPEDPILSGVDFDRAIVVKDANPNTIAWDFGHIVEGPGSDNFDTATGYVG